MEGHKSDEKACPYCGETIKAVAVLCRFCHSDLEKGIPAVKSEAPAEASDTPRVTEEEVVFEEGLHWLIYFWPAVWIIVFLAGYIATRSNQLISTVFLILMCLPLLSLIETLLTAKFTSFVVTSKRLMLKSGIVTRKIIEMPLSKIETISVTQGVIGRMVKTGDLVITGTGTSMRPLKKINDPMQFREKLTKALKTAKPKAS